VLVITVWYIWGCD